MTLNKTTDRIYYLGIIRLLACLMVVMMHSPLPTESSNRLVVLASSYLCAPCIGLFFMVSGALLLPVECDAITFLKKRLSKILAPTLVWSAIYIAITYLCDGKSDRHDLLTQVFSIPFSPQGCGILWFMYSLTGLYIIAPVISPWLEKCHRKTIIVYLSFWAVTLCFPLIENFAVVNDGIDGMFYYISGYVGYFISGYYLRRYGKTVSMKALCTLLVLALAAPVSCLLLGMEVDFYRVFWYLSPFVVIMAWFWFCSLQKIFSHTRPKNRIVTCLANLSFGIYLTHFGIMRRFVWHWDWINGINNYLFQCIAIFVCSLFISVVLSYVISLLPVADYIIGYRTKTRKL